MVLSKPKLVAGAVAVAVLAVGGIAFAAMNGSGEPKPGMTAGGPGGPGGQRGPGGPGGPGGGGGPPTQVAAVEATVRTFNVKVEALGTLEPRERVVLTANAADRVTSVNFEDGQRVAKGKVLMTMVNEEENAQLASARATEANAKLVFERNQRLAENDAIAQLELERTKSAYEAASANVGAIQARLATDRGVRRQAVLAAVLLGQRQRDALARRRIERTVARDAGPAQGEVRARKRQNDQWVLR